jgi:hypothetical protein
MPLSDEELLAELEAAGHTGAARSLRQKINARQAVESWRDREPKTSADARARARAFLEAGFAENDPVELRRRRRARGGDDGE